MGDALAVASRSKLGKALAVAGFAALAALSFACSDSSPLLPPATTATATPTPAPSATPTPTPAPSATPTPAPSATPTPTPTPAALSIISHSAAVSEDNGLIVFVNVVLSAPGRVAVEYENEYAGKFRTALSERAAEHRVPVARLRADAVYQYAVGVEKADGGGLAYGARGEFTTGALPDALALAVAKSEASGRSSQALILSDLSAHREPQTNFPHIIMLDETGEVVWHFHDGGRVANAPKVQPNGDIVYIRKGAGPLRSRVPRLLRITPLGEVVKESEFEGDRPHHDFLRLDDGRVLYIGMRLIPDESANAGNGEMRVDTINLIPSFDPPLPVPERVWDARDFGMNFEERVHMNSIAPALGGGWIASLRNPSQVISISEDFQTIRWRLGGADGDFAFPDPSDMFRRQHTAAELPNGNILVFDNQAGLPPPDGEGYYSRALELRLDYDAMTAVKAWEFVPEPRMYSPSFGSAYRLDNGNTLINFGRSQDAAFPIAIIEADARGREIFRLETMTRDEDNEEVHISVYRASPGPESIIGETMLRPPKER